MRSGSSYLHGTTAGEQRRLTLLNRLINHTSLRELKPREGDRILEMGSGLGDFARLMARRAGPGGKVLGIERSPRHLSLARRRTTDSARLRVEFRRGDVLAPPLGREEWGSFDLAHARFLLEHLQEPLAAVRAMVRAVRPGGRIVLEDDDHDLLRAYPPPRGFQRLWRAYQRSFRVLGNDPLIGRKLPVLLHAAGARPLRNTWIFFGSCAGDPLFPMFLENLVGVVASARRILLRRSLISATDFHKALRELARWGARPDASLFYAISWAEGRRPR